MSSEDLRAALYEGQILRLPACEATRGLVAATEDLLRDLLRSDDLELAWRQHTPDAFWTRIQRARAVLREDRRYLEQARGVVAATGFLLDANAVDVPRLRAILPGGHQNPRAAAAYHAHRDTWYGNPQAQLNWWIPLQDVPASRSFGFFPERFAQAVPNDSAEFDYDAFRTLGWQNYGPESRTQVYPRALDDAQLKAPRTYPLERAGLLLFASAHLHQTLPNETDRVRYSLDFRSVHRADHQAGRGAPNVDDRSRGCSLVDFPAT